PTLSTDTTYIGIMIHTSTMKDKTQSHQNESIPKKQHATAPPTIRDDFKESEKRHTMTLRTWEK
ncbi:32989_t:CDS:2, partial [Gigaspora margarita]